MTLSFAFKQPTVYSIDVKTFFTFYFWSRFLRILTFFYFFNVFLFIKKRWQNGIQITETLVSNSNKATTFRQLNRTVPFLAHPACRHTVWEWFWKKVCNVMWHSSSFLYLYCTRARHSTKCRSNVFYSTFTNVFFYFCHVFNVFF